eukprot:m.231652 g.231652  ORF g.231652 m.231652 type:complete len:328 (-) comp18434_c0_seq1:26-1009(-)
MAHALRVLTSSLRRGPAMSTAAKVDPIHRPAIVTAALNGVLTDPKSFNIPVTPEEMAVAAKQAWDEGATIVHIHFRDQRPGKGHLPSWDPQVAADVCAAIRQRCPEIVINMTTGTVGTGGPAGGGSLGPTNGPIACIDAGKPEMAALNSGSLNYLKVTKENKWAWPPMLFDNPVEKVEIMARAMRERGVVPECECFDLGIVRSVAMYERVGLLPRPYQVSFVMGVASGMPLHRGLLPLLVEELAHGIQWQVIAIGREEVWPVLYSAAALGGNVRTGLEDTFYLPDGKRATSSGQLISELVKVVRTLGRQPATIEQTRAALNKPLKKI